VRVSVNNNENGGAILTTLGQHKMCNLHIDERDVRNHPHSTIPPPPFRRARFCAIVPLPPCLPSQMLASAWDSRLTQSQA
jgi:hypothetical protein